MGALPRFPRGSRYFTQNSSSTKLARLSQFPIFHLNLGIHSVNSGFRNPDPCWDSTRISPTASTIDAFGDRAVTSGAVIFTLFGIKGRLDGVHAGRLVKSRFRECGAVNCRQRTVRRRRQRGRRCHTPVPWPETRPTPLPHLRHRRPSVWYPPMPGEGSCGWTGLPCPRFPLDFCSFLTSAAETTQTAEFRAYDLTHQIRTALLPHNRPSTHLSYFNAYNRTQENWTVAYTPLGGEAGKTIENGLNSPKNYLAGSQVYAFCRVLARQFVQRAVQSVRKRVAPCANGSPHGRCSIMASARKRRSKRQREESPKLGAPFQGWNVRVESEPRASPWAGILVPRWG